MPSNPDSSLVLQAEALAKTAQELAEYIGKRCVDVYENEDKEVVAGFSTVDARDAILETLQRVQAETREEDAKEAELKVCKSCIHDDCVALRNLADDLRRKDRP